MNYQTSRLKNGLRLVTVPMNRESVTVAVWVRIGSRYESGRLAGVSHFLEHMLFKGTRSRNTRQIKETIEGVGGMLNAYTSEECTCYFAKLLHRYYPKALEVLSDMVNDSVLPVKEFMKERPVVLEEIKMYRDQPAQYVQEVMGGLLWKNHPLGRPIAGSLKSVGAMTRAQMNAYMKRYYHPRNMLAVLSGRVEHREAAARLEKIFAGRKGRAVSRFKPAVAGQKRPQTLFIEKDTEQVNFVIAVHGFSRYHADRYVLGVLNILLGGNMSSRLFEQVREQRGLAYDVRSGAQFYEDAGLFQISAGVETGKTEKAMRVILKELAKITRTPVGAKELARAKEYFINQLEMTLEDGMDHALWLGERVLYGEDLPEVETIKARIQAVTPDDIRRVAKRLFQTRNLNLTLIGPLNEKARHRLQNQFKIGGPFHS